VSAERSEVRSTAPPVDVATGAAVVEFGGEIDLTSVERFRTAIRAAEAQGGDVTIDLRTATFIDSTGISALIGAAHHAAERAARVTVVVTEPLMRRVFAMMQLDAMLTVEPPLTAAD
jgi:anti-anti-sigma factor